jgi:glucose-6-phosphate 1-epimerase
MDKVELKSKGFTAAVTNYGAHLISWRTPAMEDLLFLSKKAVFAPPKAIR